MFCVAFFLFVKEIVPRASDLDYTEDDADKLNRVLSLFKEAQCDMKPWSAFLCDVTDILLHFLITPQRLTITASSRTNESIMSRITPLPIFQEAVSLENQVNFFKCESQRATAELQSKFLCLIPLCN